VSHSSGTPAYGGLPPLPPELDPRGRRKHAHPSTRGGNARHASVLLVKVLSAALSIFIVVYIGYLWQTARGLNQNVQRLTIKSIGGKSVDPKTGKTKTRADIDGQDQNLLIVGNDDRSQMTNAQVHQLRVGRDGGSLNTDSMMIVHVPADGSKATLISLPRDEYVSIPGYGMNKLNAAYALAYNDASGNANAKRAAGADELVRTIENLTGLNIDHFVQVSLLGFVNISDAVGGVQVNLCKSVNDTVAYNRSVGQSGGSGLVLSKGQHTIKGVQALEFVRQRENLPNGDIDRTARQRYFLTAAFRKVASAGTLLNIGRLRNLITAVDKSIYVDSGLNILDLARQMSNLSANNIVGKSVPFDHFADVNIGGTPQSVEIVDPATVQAFVKNLIGTDTSAYKDATTVDPTSVTVDIENGGTVNGGASAASNTLKQAGFSTSTGNGLPAQKATEIRYPKGMEAQAKTLAQYVPGATVDQAAGVQTLTLVLGSDHLKAHSTPTKPKPPKSSKNKSHKAIDSGCIN
jgi:LCP family protein required for cell wall assembly